MKSTNATKRQQQPEETYLNVTKDSDPEKFRKCRWGRTFKAQDAQAAVHPSPGFWVHLQTFGVPSSCSRDPKDSLDRADENLVTLKGAEVLKRPGGNETVQGWPLRSGFLVF